MDRNVYVDPIMKRLSKRIKKGDLTVETEKKLDGLVVIRYHCKDVWPGIGYGHIISPFEMVVFEFKIDDLVEYIVSEMADEMKKAGYDPADYLEV